MRSLTPFTRTMPFGGRSVARKVIATTAVVALVALQSLVLAVNATPARADTVHSLWTSTTVPQIIGVTDNQPIELGLRFSSDTDGFITGVRFYKAAVDTGSHIGHLWTADGTLLAEAAFSNESASGWQEIDFASPVAIEAGTTYVASYWSASGYFSDTPDYFATAGYDNAPLHAPAAPNGMYRYGTSGFPTEGSTFNYWVDVAFTTQTGPDTTAPTITHTVPAAGATDVSPSATVNATFDESLDASTVSASTFSLRDTSGTVAADVTYDATTRSATLHPHAALTRSTVYTATVEGGASGVADLAGNHLADDVSWSFTTAAQPAIPADDGPGGPILVVADAGDPFGRYYGEILRTEGLSEFLVTDISKVDATLLHGYDVVVLASMPLDSARLQMFTDWVNGGGNLIAMRPDTALAPLAGLASASGTLAEGYLAVDTSPAPGAGIVDDTIQFHGTADRYTLGAAQAIATLYADADDATTNPAVTLRSVGTNGGHVSVFTYDLARSVVETRQGNPAWSGQKRDGESGPIRSDDLFFGASATDPEPDWVNLDKVQIPQADEQQRLLVNIIETMQAQTPLPRLWYFPDDAKAVVVMTGDDHANGGTAGRFDTYEADSAAGCSLDDWSCIRSTAYVYPSTPLTDEQVQAYQAAGFEVALHVSTDCADWTPASLAADYDAQLAEFAAAYPSATAPVSGRSHCIAWSDWATQPKVEAAHGIRLDTNYYYWPPSWLQDRPGLFTGSGMPMRFADTDGTTIDVFQAATQMTDESGQSYPATIDTLLANALGPNEFYGAFTANMHNDSADSSGADAIVASAQRDGVPVVSAGQMLTWLDARDASSFSAITLDDGTLTFTINAGAKANGLRAMLPVHGAGGDLTTLQRGQAPVAYSTATVNGVEYAFFDAAGGDYTATYEAGTTPTAGSFVDTTTANFAAGTTGDSTAVTPDGDGALTLRPSATQAFDGTTLPNGWSSTTWGDGGTATVSGGALTVDGAQAGTDATFSPGTTLEFTGTFGNAPYEHVGFATAEFDGPWALFSTGRDGTSLQARTNLTENGTSDDETIPGSWLGSPHRYRIVWGTDSVTFFIDGNEIASHAVTIAGPMRAAVSDFDTGGASVTVDDVALTPYVPAGTFTSRVFDAGAPAAWGTLDADATLPAGTGIDFAVRTGDTPTPDGTWSAWAPIVPGQSIGASARYAQYSAALATTDSAVTPVLLCVNLAFDTAAANHAPVANDDGYTTDEDTPLVANVLGNDTDADGDTLQAMLAVSPAHGTLTFAADGAFTYQPAPNWNGTDTFSYGATDGTDASDVATVTITVNAVNDPPTLTAPADQVTTTGDNVTLTVDGHDVDGDQLTFTATGLPPGLSMADDGTVSGTAGGATDTPYLVTVVADDHHGGTAQAGFEWTIVATATNHAPTVTAQRYTTTTATRLVVAAPGVLAGSHDADGTALRAVLAQAAGHGTVSLRSDGGFTYVPNAGFVGTDTFMFRASDGALSSKAATITITVAAQPATPVAAARGYRLVASDGGVFTFGNAHFYGSTGNLQLHAPIVGMATTPDDHGYWLVASDGGVFAFGNAHFYGSTGNLQLHAPIVGMVTTPDGHGYWLVASDGGVFAFGNAHFYGAAHVAAAVAGIAATPRGHGYWLVTTRGGVVPFGDAETYSPASRAPLMSRNVVGIVSTPGGHGYWLVTSNGSVAAHGDAWQSTATTSRSNQPMVGMRASGTGHGYWLVAGDGGVFSLGDARFYGSTGALRLVQPIVGIG